MGNAVIKACAQIRRQLQAIAARALRVDESAIEVAPGEVKTPNGTLTYAEVMQAGLRAAARERSLASAKSGAAGICPTHPLGGRPEFWEFMCTAVEVEVDPETGMVDVTRLVLASDVGKALNPQQVEAQDEGAAVMGVGHSLMEELILDASGRIVNLGAMDYRIPTIQDIPRQLHSVLIENEDGPGPYGAKGAGEGGILGIAGAIGAAVNQAAGVAIRDLPLTPERIWRAIQSARAELL